MNRQYTGNGIRRRLLAGLLSLLMLLQTVGAFAEDIAVPETEPIVTAGMPAEPEQEPVSVSDAAEEPAAQPEEISAEEPAVLSETASAEEQAAPSSGIIPEGTGEENPPAEEQEIPEGTVEIQEDNDDEPPAGDPEILPDEDHPAEPADDPEVVPEAPETISVIDTSGSITMLQAGFVPAPVYFEGVLVHEGPDYTVTAVIGQDAMFPADVAMRVEEILPGTELYALYIEMMEETMEADEEMGEFARFFDIAFIADVDGEKAEIEPQADIDVQITFQEAIEVTEETDVQAVHIEDDMPQILDVSTDSLEAAVHDDEAIDTVSFSSDSFSVYGVYQKVKKVLKVITASGETFTIDVTFTSDSGIPDDAELSAKEITPEDPEYDALCEQAILALDAGDIGGAHFFDISISVNGGKIEPSGPVTVVIAMDEMPENSDTVAVVHFGEEATDIINDIEVTGTDIQFQADSFSVYGVITDPTNEVNNLNGKIATIGRNGEYLTATTLNNNTPRLIGKTNNASQAAQYYFVSTGTAGKYYIYTIDPETQSKLYINLKYRGGQSREADCFLSGEPQELTVEQYSGDYRIRWTHPAGTSFALDHWQNGGGAGFGGYVVSSNGSVSNNHRMTLNFVNGAEPPGEKYVVIVKREENYYTVQGDGILVPCVYHKDTNLVEMESPVMWTYSNVNGECNLKIAEEAIQFLANLLPTDFAYRYINPNSGDGYTDEDKNSNAAGISKLQYENHTLHGIGNNSGNYIGVSENNGKLSISGLNSAADAAEVYLAIPMLPSSAYGRTNAVNHIDISVKGSANMNIAFPYGTYYDEDGTEIVVDRAHPLSYSVESYPIAIKQEDMMRSEVSAYKLNSDGSQTPLDDMFYITGYSDNGENGTTSSSDQVRIEGFFKVSYTNVPGQNGDEDSQRARLATKVYYTVTVPKSVTIPLEYNGKKVYKENPKTTTNPSPQRAEVNTTVILSASLTYWDFENNKCPGCTLNNLEWRSGDIPDGGGDYIAASGMDFVLEYIGGTGTYAIEIVKYVVDEHGLPIQVASEPRYSFDVFYSKNQDPNCVEQYPGRRDPSELSTLKLDSYTRLHTQTAQVGSNGSGVLYDYDAGALVSDTSYAMFYIKEDPESIDQTIVDVDGEKWEYTGKTTIVTEYVTRGEKKPDQDHEVQGYTSFPEVIGNFTYNGNTEQEDFLEFHVYNEYTNRKAEIQITKFLVDDENKDEDNNYILINPMMPVESKFYLYGKSGNPDDVITLNKMTPSSEQQGGYTYDAYTPYDAYTAPFITEENLVNPVPVTVGSSGWDYTYESTVPGRMYTIREDKNSIPDQIVDTQGFIWEYTGTEILTEYAWRKKGDEGARHYSAAFTKSNGDYTAVPEVLGPYSGIGEENQNLYNGYLDFFVYNKYHNTGKKIKTDSLTHMQVDTLGLVLNKLWKDEEGNSSSPESGTVTFLLHQVKTTTTTITSGGGGGGGNPNAITVELYAKDRQTKYYTENVIIGEVGDTVRFSFLTDNPWSGANVCVQPLNQSWNDTLTYVMSMQDSTGSFTYTIDSRHVIGGKVKLFFDNDIAGFRITDTSCSGGSGSGSSSGGEETITTTTTTEEDPVGSGFPMEITLSQGNGWTWQENGLLAEVVQGNITMEYSYWLQEVGGTGKARQYKFDSFVDDDGSSTEPKYVVSGAGTHKVTAINKYDSTILDTKKISVGKTWQDQEGKDLFDHPTEISAKVYRIKLPVAASYSDGIKFKEVGGPYAVIGQPTTWQDNGNEILNDVVFYYKGDYYYVRKGQFIFNRAQLQDWISMLDRGQMDGDHTTRLTGRVWTIEGVKAWAAENKLIERGDVCIYEGDYWVFGHTGGAFGTMSHTYGPDVDGNWHKIGTRNFYNGITIDLMPNSGYYTEAEIRGRTIPEMVASIERQLEGTGISWPYEDQTLEYYTNISITEEDEGWKTDFIPKDGYLYFVFENPIPGYTTTYGFEEYGVFDQLESIEIVNMKTPTEFSFAKAWRKSGMNIKWPEQETITVTLYRYADAEQPDVKGTYILSPDLESPKGWTVTENDDETVTFRISGLEAFDDNGNPLTYYVKEAGIPGYTTTYAKAGGQTIDGGDRALDGQTIVNTAYADVRVIKRNYTTQAKMTGAEFRLDRKNGEDTFEPVGNAAEVNNDGELLGELIFTGLPDGEYRITETKAPAGYMPLASPITFTIANGKVNEESIVASSLVNYTAATESLPATFTVDNRPGVALPSTGGEGTAPYILTGIALMAFAGILLMDRKRKTHK